MNDPKFYRILESSIKFGCPLIIEDVDEDIDSILDPIFLN